MDSFAQALAASRSTVYDRGTVDTREENRQKSLIEKIDRTNEGILNNPGLLDGRVADMVNQISPAPGRPKYGKFTTKTDAVDASMPEDHPLAGLAGRVKTTLQSKLASSQGTGKTFEQLTQEAMRENINDEDILKTFEYKAKADSSYKNFFGIFNEDSSVRIPEALRADYANWKNNVMQERKNSAELSEDPNAKDYAINSIIGTAAGIGLGALSVAGTVLSGGTAAPAGAVGLIASEALLGGALAIPGTYGGTKLRQGYRKTEAGTFHQGDLQDKVVGAITAATMFALGARSAGIKSMLATGAVGGAIGAASPDMGMDLAGFMGLEGIVKAGGFKAFKHALDAGVVNENLKEIIKVNPQAANIIKNYDMAQEAKVNEARVTAAMMDRAMRETAAKTETAHTNWKNFNSTMKFSDAVDGDLSSDVRSMITDLNNELRDASEYGRNILANSVDTRVQFKTIGKGKKKTVDVPLEEITKARSAMHFNQFLDDMATDTTHADYAARVQALKEEEAYQDLFSNYVYQGSANEALETISMDGLNRAMGDVAGGNWKMLSLGSRVQIVTAEEQASASLLARSVGEDAAATRLDAIKKSVVSATRKALKGTPEEFAPALEQAASIKGSPYLVDGKLNLVQLQQDLQHYGFYTLHQFAHSSAEELSTVLKTPRKWEKFKKATETIRNIAATSNVTKLGVTAAAGLGAYNLGENNAEAGIINTDTINAIRAAGGKVWNYSMQKFTPKVAEELITKAKPQYFEEQFGKLEYARQQLKNMIAERDAGFPTVHGTTLSQAQKDRSISGIHTAIKHHGDTANALEKELTKGEYTLAEIRRIITGNKELTWDEEKKLLEQIGIDTENGVVSVTGTNSGRFDFGYKESSDSNLYDPGATYSTTGAVKEGRETITGGYSGANNVLSGKTALEHLTTTNPLSKEKVAEYVDVIQRERDALPKGAQNTRLRVGLKHLIRELETSGEFDPSLHLFGDEAVDFLRNKGIQIEKPVSGPNVRAYHFKPEKPFDMHEMYTPSDFGLALSSNSPMPGAELWYSLNERLGRQQERIYNSKLNEYVKEFTLKLKSEYGDQPVFDNVIDMAQKGKIAPEEIRDIKDFLHERASGNHEVEFSQALKNIRDTYDIMPSRLANNNLKDLGYDSITHIGGFNTRQEQLHRVWIPLKDEMVSPFFTIQNKLAEKMNLKAVFSGAAVSAVVPATVVPDEDQGKLHAESVLSTAKDYFFKGLDALGSLVSPAEADAATLDMLTKMSKGIKVSPAVVEYAKAAGKESKNIIKDLSDANLLFRELPENAITGKGFRTSYLQTAPATENDIPSIITNTAQVFPGQKSLTSPQFGVMIMFKNVVRGDEFKGSAAAQLAHGQSVVADNTRKSLKIYNNIMRTYDIPISTENSRAISAHMAPIQEALEEVSFPLRAQEIALNENKKALKKFLADIGDDPKEKIKYADALAARESLNDTLTDNVVKLSEQFEQRKIKLDESYKYLAYRYPEARISLALEDTASFEKYPWLSAILKPNERKAVIALKDMLDEYRERITSIMGEESTIAGEYIKHSRGPSAKLDKRMADLQAFFDKAGLRGEEIIGMTKLHSRTRYSMQMIPDVTRNIGEYIPDVETRLMNADFWKLGKPGGWDAVRQSSIVQNSPTLKAFFQQLADSVKPVEETYLRNLSTKYAAIESTRLLFGSVSASFKHAMKIVGDMRTLGVVPTLSTMPQALAVAGRSFVRGRLESLERIGLLEKGTAQNTWRNKKVLDDFVAGTINQRGMMDYLTDIEKRYGKPSDSLFDRIMGPVSTATSVGIKAVETFDRSVTVLMAMKMAAKKGMTGQQAMYSIYDTILKNNFLSGQLNSAWARDPNMRALFLFQSTPFKIWERRIADAVVAKRDLKTAWGIIKNTDLPKEYAELQGIGKFIKQAEISFKSNMIQQALNRDVFGQSTTKQLVKEMILVGGMLSGGSALGVNLTGHLLHVPFIKQDEGDIKMSISPIAQAAIKTAAGRAPAGYDDYTPEDHFFAANFLRNWYGTTGPLLMGSKFKRLNTNDIPEIYQGSKWKFLFSIPAAGQGH